MKNNNRERKCSLLFKGKALTLYREYMFSNFRLFRSYRLQ